MGFLRKFFSLGSRKSKRKNETRTTRVDPTGKIVRAQEPWQHDQEGDATRLLRSSSAHFNVVKEVDYSTLPPLPHPINSVVPTPAVTPTKSVSSMQRRGTYTVKVLERKLESRTEFPNANPPFRNEAPPASDRQKLSLEDEHKTSARSRIESRSVPFTPRDQSRIIRLRQDPSVASLLTMYDDKGRIDSHAFSNSPATPSPIHGREPVKRSGSTLRQLLGETAGDNAEADISWADRFLGEHANSSQCSLASTAPIETPKDFLFTNDFPTNKKPAALKMNATYLSETSQELSAALPAISSMEVEVSGTDHNLEVGAVSSAGTTTPKTQEPKTPMRASEVFGFLSERRKTVLERQKSQRALETITPAHVDPSTDRPARQTAASGDPDTSDTSIIITSAQIHTATLTKVTPVQNPLSAGGVNILKATQASTQQSHVPVPSTRPQMTGDSQTSTNTTSTSSSKIPRGPRPLPPTSSTAQLASSNPSKVSLGPEIYRDSQQDANTKGSERSVGRSHAASTRIPILVTDPFTPVKQRHHRRTVPHTSSVASNDGEPRKTGSSHHHHKRSRKAERVQVDKENTPPSASATAATNAAPLRTIFDKRYPNMANGEPPSPASSTELSPMTKDMMASLRKQRMKTRESMRGSMSRSPRRRP